MMDLSKYRKLSVLAVIVMVIAWLSALVAYWNRVINTGTQLNGWVVLFMFLVLCTGGLLFYLAYISNDSLKMETLQKESYEKGKSEILQELGRKKQEENDQQVDDADIKNMADKVLAGINAVRTENSLCNRLLAGLAREMGFVQGVMYIKKESIFYPAGEYALTERKPEPFREGETITSQAVSGKSITVIYDIPENYFNIASGLGSSAPKVLLLAPVVNNNETIAVLELAAFRKPDALAEKVLEMVLTEAGSKLNKLLSASQS